ncbi:histone-lysine N-methyltransferase SETMAR-like [Melitaea cinxia]|uniref:histone-lysine N-methyltransferase SETMAR-like n=1 Tax=Melitaea cinxia TaxID=113334 RepID=UPI001E274054|nr:histone-lysine N-methyltransferase SETMAR-like [Melitaea cinxia]
MVGVSDTTIFKILHDHLGMTKVSARWVPRMLTPPQKQQRVECSRAFLYLCNEDKDGVLSRIVTGDETWVHHYEPESKQDSMQWHKKVTAPPKKFKLSQSAGKFMATVFWDSEGILLIDYKDKGVSITGEYYASILERLKEAIKEKRRGKLTKGVLLLHENAPVHKSHVALAALLKVGFDILNHSPHSPDLVPSDYYLFPKMKKELRGKKFTTDDEVKEAVSGFFEDKDKTFFNEGINKLIERSEKCVRLAGEYIDKEK